MVENGWGRIINISSVNGEKGQFGQTNYSAAKAGMHGFTMALAQEVAQQGRHRQHRAPGLHRHRHGQGDPPGGARQDRRQIPVKRLGKPEEIASIVAWLASEEAGYIHRRRLLGQRRPAHDVDLLCTPLSPRRRSMAKQRIAVVTGGMGGLGETISHQDGRAGLPGGRDLFARQHQARRWLAADEGARLRVLGVPGATWPTSTSCARGCRARSRPRSAPIDILVNNAGITRDMTFKKMDKVDWDAVMRTNLDAVLQHDQAGRGRHGRARLGPRDQRLVGERLEGRVRPDQLLGGQGRHARLHQGAGARSGAQGRDRQHHLARLHRHEDGDGDPEGNPRLARSCRRSRSAGSASPKRSPG